MNPWAAQIDDTLSLTERRITEILSDSNRLVRECVAEVSRSRGKRLRPRLMVVHAALAGGAEPRSVANCAACCELLHTASLIHDDVIDEAQTRRGAATLNQLFGNEIAVVVGDYILASLLRSLATERDFALIDMLISTSQELGLGVIEEVRNRDNLRLSEEHYFEVIYLKTAALFALCCGMGAYLGGADERAQELSRAYGKQLGLAFQVVDDLLDLLAEPSAIGKPALSDIREGRVTLPLIHAFRSEPEATQQLYAKAQAVSTDGAPQAIREHLARLGSLRHAYASASELLARARVTGEELAALSKFPLLESELAQIEQHVIGALPVNAELAVV